MDETKTKVCSQCGVLHSTSFFYRQSDREDGLRSECKDCTKARNSEYNSKNKAKIAEARKTYREENRDIVRARKKLYREENIDKVKAKGKRYYEENKVSISEKSKLYREENVDSIKEAKKKYYEEHRDQAKTYREQNKDKASSTWKKYYEENKDKLARARKIYQAENKSKIAERSKNYQAKNKDKIKHYWQTRFDTDIQYRISKSLRSRLYSAVRGDSRGGSAIRDLGCSVEFLKQHLESLFSEGMSWENWGAGPGKWNIDHIVPITAFDLTDRQHILLSCHYGNLQPLWFEDNIRKLDTIPTRENYKIVHEYNKLAA